MSSYVDPIRPETPFGEHLLGEVGNFTCGKPDAVDERWETDVSEWIKDPGPFGALGAIRTQAAEVWLYHLDGKLLGFGSIGTEELVFPDSTNSTMVYTLPCLGIHTQFRSQKFDPPNRSYGRRILGGLIEEVERRGQFPWLLLYVDPDNPARKLYMEFGFRDIGQWTDDSERIWMRMIRPIPLQPTHDG